MLSPLKRCSRCKIEKSISEYNKRSNQKDGLDYYCKECKALINKNPKRRFWEKSPKGYATSLRNKAKIRAKNKKLDFSISREFILNKLLIGICEVTGISFEISNKRNKYTPSLDRIDPTLGYTEENTRLVVWIYNAMKSTFTDEEVLEFIGKIKKCH